ncbi:VHS domain-containing protein [Fimicolochytrium jonesii]|uniref:VHS domain-containing protein n=1 Tax=Fimicolochytrium jonesii TaxID=1396493 RepID=UPI0022FF1FB2|nr:VHS domain-containing protein [Fimicolochytrium jonesii]KAI8820394.1 VHS domain-containing protein [Fimicolochytrium jonesii]
MLEICDIINQKGKSSPREAAFAIVRNVNRGGTQTAMHALLLLDYCTKNCGYPFHLIIATKEFLNELVKRFPERPTTTNSVHHRILELVQTWNATLCVTSRYKEDFKHINDMYRLLSYKGYRFPPLSKDAAAALNPTNTLRTQEELEQEDKLAQGAKLQELLRQGTPAALEQANDLMKIMSGYDTERIPDYKKQAEEELNRIEQRAILLNDILTQKQPEDRHKHDSTMEELLGSAKSAQSRIQKLISDGDDDERMGRLLETNDLINTVINKHADFKAGKPIQGGDARPAQPNTTSPTKPPDTGISLIDLDDWGAPGPAVSPGAAAGLMAASTVSKPAAAPSGGGGFGSLMDALGDLNFSTPTTQTPPLQTAAPFPHQQPASYLAQPGVQGFSTPPQGFSTPPQGFSTPPLQSNAFSGLGGLGFQPQQPQQGFGSRPQQQPQQGQGSNAWGTPTAFPGTPPVYNVQQQQQPQQQQKPDPFAGVDLFGKLAGIQASTSSAPGTPPPGTIPGTPPVQQQRKEVMLHDKNGLQIKYRLLWKGNAWAATAVFINVTPVPFTDLTFQVAAPKSMTLHMETASGTLVPPLNQAQVTQGMHIVNPGKEPLRVRYKVQYAVNGAVVNEGGEYNEAAPV